MNEDALSGRALDVEIAKATGWVDFVDGDRFARRQPGDVEIRRVPSFSTSLDALSAGPERLLREAGMNSMVVSLADANQAPFSTSWQRNTDFSSLADVTFGATESESRARAALAALRAMNGANGE